MCTVLTVVLRTALKNFKLGRKNCSSCIGVISHFSGRRIRSHAPVEFSNSDTLFYFTVYDVFRRQRVHCCVDSAAAADANTGDALIAHSRSCCKLT